MPKDLPFRLNDYLELIDWTGRTIPESKLGHIPDDLPSILERRQLELKHWFYMTQNFESRFKGLVGMSTRLVATCRSLVAHLKDTHRTKKPAAPMHAEILLRLLPGTHP